MYAYPLASRHCLGVSSSDAGGVTSSALTLAPNPASDELMVLVTLHDAADVRLGLFDAGGRAVASLNAGRLSAGAHRLPLDLSSLPSGVYLLRVDDRTERVVVVR